LLFVLWKIVKNKAYENEAGRMEGKRWRTWGGGEGEEGEEEGTLNCTPCPAGISFQAA
jgi:hypothetical protein